MNSISKKSTLASSASKKSTAKELSAKQNSRLISPAQIQEANKTHFQSNQEINSSAEELKNHTTQKDLGKSTEKQEAEADISKNKSSSFSEKKTENQEDHQSGENHSLKANSQAKNSSLSKIKSKLIALEKWLLKKPFLTLAIFLAILFALIFVGNQLRSPEPTEEKVVSTKQVKVFTTGAVPRVEVVGTGIKTGVVTISAQASGIVNRIGVEAGQQIKAGTRLVNLSTNYSGGNSASLQRAIAQKQQEFNKNTFQTQLDTINLQREISGKDEANYEELKKITEKSIAETKDLISLNESIIQSYDEVINSTSATQAEIKAAKQGKSQYLASTNQLKNALRNNEYQVNSEKPPADLNRLYRELTLKQLDIQEASLRIQQDVTALQTKLAQVNESVYYPSSPFAGKVERVFVRLGQQVNPGTPLFTIFAESGTTQIIVPISSRMATQIALSEPSIVSLSNGEKIELFPNYVSQVPTEGVMHSILYTLPPQWAEKVGEKQKLRLSVPVGVDIYNGVVSIPIEAVHETEQQVTVFVFEEGFAKARQVKLGLVQGLFVEVLEGLQAGDKIILDRNVIDGDKVEPIWMEEESLPGALPIELG